MIKKNEEQFDGGGVILKYLFLLGFKDLKIPTEDITEDMVDAYVKEKSLDFEWEFKSFLMMKLGYIGKEGDVWIKEPVVSCSNEQEEPLKLTWLQELIGAFKNRRY